MVRLQTSARTRNCNTSSFSISGISHFSHYLPGFLLTLSYTPTSTTVNHTEVSNSLNLPPFLTASYSVSCAPLSRLNPRSIIIITSLHAPHLPAVSPTELFNGQACTPVTANTSGSLPATVQLNSEAREQTATPAGLTVNVKTASPRVDPQVSPMQQPCCICLHIQF